MRMAADSLDQGNIVKPVMKKATLTMEVIAGVHAGAHQQLGEQEWWVLGGAEDCDVILNDEAVAPHHCLVGMVGGRLILRCLEAELHWNDETLQPGDAIKGVPWGELQLGVAVIRIQGEVRRRQWSSPNVRHYGRVMLTLLLSMAATYGMAISMWGADTDTGTVIVNDETDLAARGELILPKIEKDEDGVHMAVSTQEILRLSGIEAKSQYVSDGKVEISGFFGDGVAVSRIVQSRAMREIRGLKQVVVVNRSAPVVTASAENNYMSPPVLRTKMIKIISGNDPYLVATDGSRYYPGAMLPNGARLLSVLEQEVIVETEKGEEAIMDVDALLGN